LLYLFWALRAVPWIRFYFYFHPYALEKENFICLCHNMEFSKAILRFISLKTFHLPSTTILRSEICKISFFLIWAFFFQIKFAHKITFQSWKVQFLLL
jgi:hypothetical protein